MSVLELKGELLEMVSAVHSEKLLMRLRDTFIKIREEEEEVDINNILSPEQVAEFEVSLAESYSDENLMDISEAKQMHARWLQK